MDGNLIFHKVLLVTMPSIHFTKCFERIIKIKSKNLCCFYLTIHDPLRPQICIDLVSLVVITLLDHQKLHQNHEYFHNI